MLFSHLLMSGVRGDFRLNSALLVALVRVGYILGYGVQGWRGLGEPCMPRIPDVVSCQSPRWPFPSVLPYPMASILYPPAGRLAASSPATGQAWRGRVGPIPPRPTPPASSEMLLWRVSPSSAPYPRPRPLAHHRAMIGCTNRKGMASGFRSSKTASAFASTRGTALNTRAAHG